MTSRAVASFALTSSAIVSANPVTSGEIIRKNILQHFVFYRMGKLKEIIFGE
jgi:hypothetical protein